MKIEKLYKNACQAKKRIENLGREYKNIFGVSPADFFSSPGRAEILGNHTDHNKGCVLVGAIESDILCACSKRNDDKIIIKSKGFESIETDAGDFALHPQEKGTSAALVRGILKGVNDLGFSAGGFNAVTVSDVFKGAGVSSSAAFELLICAIINHYYCFNRLTPLQCAKISQYAENLYFGKPCGLLDQCGIAFGGINYIDFTDTENPRVTPVSARLEGYDIVIVNCGGDHSELTPHYAAVKEEMQLICEYFEKSYLREIPFEEFTRELPQICKKYPGRAVLRAFHYYQENIRVSDAANYISADTKKFFETVNQSGESSYTLLQNCYVPGDDKQRIPLAIKLTKEFLKGEGAVRVHGGGFEGTILAFVPNSLTDKYLTYMEMFFGGGSALKTAIREAGATKIDLYN